MKIVLTYGTFDYFHYGHYNFLKQAKAYDGTKFDSGWEVIVYEYALSKGYQIDRQIPIVYGKDKKTTLIDFKINGVLYEVKGKHLLNEVYNNFDMSEKLDCYAQNNIIIITDINKIKNIRKDIVYIDINNLNF